MLHERRTTYKPKSARATSFSSTVNPWRGTKCSWDSSGKHRTPDETLPEVQVGAYLGVSVVLSGRNEIDPVRLPAVGTSPGPSPTDRTLNDNNSDSVRSIDSEDSETVPNADVFEEGSAVRCPSCGGDMDYLSPEYVKCTDCDADYSHYYRLASGKKMHELRDADGELLAGPVEREIEDATVDLVTDGGTSERPGFVDPNQDYARCHFCGVEWKPTEVDGFDLSDDDEYYPRMVPVCPENAGGCR